MVGAAHQQRVSGYQGQRQANLDAASFARFGLDVERSADARDAVLNRIQSDSSSRKLRGRGPCREVRAQDELAQLHLREGLPFAHQATFLRGLSNLGPVEARAVVLATYQDLVAFSLKLHTDLSDRILPGFRALRFLLDSVVNGVSQNVH